MIVNHRNIRIGFSPTAEDSRHILIAPLLGPGRKDQHGNAKKTPAESLEHHKIYAPNTRLDKVPLGFVMLPFSTYTMC